MAPEAKVNSVMSYLHVKKIHRQLSKIIKETISVQTIRVFE